MTLAAIIGVTIGLANGALCRGALQWACRRSGRMFFSVWGAGIACRLLIFVLAAVCLAKKTTLPPMPALMGLVAGHFAVGIIPLKRPAKPSGCGIGLRSPDVFR